MKNEQIIDLTFSIKAQDASTNPDALWVEVASNIPSGNLKSPEAAELMLGQMMERALKLIRKHYEKLGKRS